MGNYYTIKVTSNNPEYNVGKKLEDGIEVEGFLLLTIRNGEPHAETIQGMSGMDLTRFFLTDTEVCSVLRQAAVIADGMRAAKKIKDEDQMRNAVPDLMELITRGISRAQGGNSDAEG